MVAGQKFATKGIKGSGSIVVEFHPPRDTTLVVTKVQGMGVGGSVNDEGGLGSLSRRSSLRGQVYQAWFFCFAYTFVNDLGFEHVKDLLSFRNYKYASLSFFLNNI